MMKSKSKEESSQIRRWEKALNLSFISLLNELSTKLQNFHDIFENNFDMLRFHEFLEIKMQNKISADWKRQEGTIQKKKLAIDTGYLQGP